MLVHRRQIRGNERHARGLAFEERKAEPLPQAGLNADVAVDIKLSIVRRRPAKLDVWGHARGRRFISVDDEGNPRRLTRGLKQGGESLPRDDVRLDSIPKRPETSRAVDIHESLRAVAPSERKGVRINRPGKIFDDPAKSELMLPPIEHARGAARRSEHDINVREPVEPRMKPFPIRLADHKNAELAGLAAESRE